MVSAPTCMWGDSGAQLGECEDPRLQARGWGPSPYHLGGLRGERAG